MYVCIHIVSLELILLLNKETFEINHAFHLWSENDSVWCASIHGMVSCVGGIRESLY